jgi:UDP-N-acetylglucosamine 1-carboxyvinyltransferase
MGARIEGAGTSTITITGVSSLDGCEYRIPSDRLQAGTYLLAAAITKGDITVRGILPEYQTATITKLREAGAEASEGSDWVRVAADKRLKGIRVKTMPYPGFPTDMQQPMAAVLTVARGNSVVEETIYESRIGHVPELNRMGAKVRVEGRSTLIEGVPTLTGALVQASDLRAGAGLVLAGLAAEGETFIKNVHFIDRGYDDLEGRIGSLGGEIERLDETTWENTYAHRIKSGN